MTDCPSEILLSLPHETGAIRFGSVEQATAPPGPPPTRVALVVDSNAAPPFVEGCRRWIGSWGVPFEELSVTGGEEVKSVDVWLEILTLFHRIGLDRGGCVVAVGGGAVADAVGFAAAAWHRGVRWVGVPTTLLGMVDAFVGGKTGINHEGLKNQLGAFHLPTLVQMDPAGLVGLSDGEIRSGWGEMIKAAMIGDADLFSSFERGEIEAKGVPSLDVIERCVRVKADVVASDFKESGRRMVLNLGHTLGHALEEWAGPGMLRHGEAVAVGINFASHVAVDLGLAPPSVVHRLASVLDRGGLPGGWQPECSDQLLSLMARDKKNRAHRFWMALPMDVGRVEPHRVSLEAIASRLRQGLGGIE